MDRAAVKARKRQRPSREEKAAMTYRRLMDAAAKVVGRDGYAQTSIAKVAGEAGVANGTFYNYFEDRQALLDTLLPYVGREMTDRITADVLKSGAGLEREIARFRSYCDYLAENPGFYRILYEAEVFAPKAHAEHVRRLSEGYRRALDRAVAKGDITGYSGEELDDLIAMFLGARGYIAMRYIKDGAVPESAIQAYGKLLGRGLFAENAAKTEGDETC